MRKNMSGPVHNEGQGTEAIENETAKVPSDYFLFAAGGLMTLSLALKLLKQDHKSLFFGQWVAPLLLFGVYNKIVKTAGHDKEDVMEKQWKEELSEVN
jgi:hypothetical protein